MQISKVGDTVIGHKLIAMGRRISKVYLIAGTAAHRMQRVNVEGKPAKCYVDIPLKTR